MVKKILLNINFVLNLIYKKIYIIHLLVILKNLMMIYLKLNIIINKYLNLLDH